MDNIELGKRLKQARISCNYTLEDVAKKIGVAKSTIQRYENGKIEKIKLPIIESIAGVLNVNPSWLIGKSENMKLHKNNIILGSELDRVFQKISEEKDIPKNNLVNLFFSNDYSNLPDDRKILSEENIRYIIDELLNQGTKNINKIDSAPRILQYYEKLNGLGKKEATKRVEELTYFPQYTSTTLLNAAHAYENASEDEQTHDEDIMDDDKLWGDLH